ncbi:MAG TPA: GAF domain-containing protein, partial [Prosthecobacter sp.]|nr:GAF domain-containing protein [Prosthecobacter sp.]
MAAKRASRTASTAPGRRRARALQPPVEETLEVQRLEIEELVRGQADLEESLFQYVGLYEDAPIGFLTLTAQGSIARINLTGAAMLGYERNHLVGRHIRLFLMDRSDGLKLADHLRRCRLEEGRVESLLAIKTARGGRLDINLISHSRGATGAFYHTAMVDLTEKLRAEHQLSAHARRIELLSSVASQLLMGETPRMLLGNIFFQIATELHVQYYFNYLVSPATAKLVLENSMGLSEEQKLAFAELCVGEALCGLAAHKREPIVLSARQLAACGAAGAVRGLGVRAYACYPLIARDRLLGTLSFAATDRDEFSEEELQFMRTVRGLVTASMDRARLMTEISAARDAAEHA